MAPQPRPKRLAPAAPAAARSRGAGSGRARSARRIGRPRGKPSAETRAAIVAAARQHFASVGFERATNRAIAQDAGVTAAAIYQYFASKTELYVAVTAETIDHMLPQLRAAAERAPSARAALSAIVRAQLGIEQDPVSARFMASIAVEMQRHPELAQAMVAQPGSFFALVIDVVKRGVRDGEIARDKAEQVVAVFIATLIGLSIHGSTVPASHAQAAVAGFIALLEGSLFD